MRRGVATIVVGVLLLAGCTTQAPEAQQTSAAPVSPAPMVETSEPATPQPTADAPQAQLGTIASGLDVPWSIAFFGEGRTPGMN